MKFKLGKGIRGLFGAVASIATVLGAGCHSKHGASIENITLRRGLGGEPGSLDPGAAADS
jgi:ABC-type oligopeptide transport system substrate-binding subunit